MEGVDLYSDLEDPFFFNDCPAQPPDQVSETKANLPGNARVKELEQQNEKLTEQNKALRMNISCLYKTARSELDRKEAMIVGLVTRVKNLETTVSNHQQQQQQIPLTNTTCEGTAAISEATLTAAAYYQAQLLLLANPACLGPGVAGDGGGGAGVDYNALSEYYKQMFGLTLNDRTPTSSDAGTPLPSDGEGEEDKRVEEEEGSLDPFEGESLKKAKRVSQQEVRRNGETERDKHRGKGSRSRRRLSPKGTLSAAPITAKKPTDEQRDREMDTRSLTNNGRQTDNENAVKVSCVDLSNVKDTDIGVKGDQRQSSSPPAQRRKHDDRHENKPERSSDTFVSSITERNDASVHKVISISKRDAVNRQRHSPRREGRNLPKGEREAREAKEPQRESVMVKRSNSRDSQSSMTSRSSSLRTRARSPSHDKENARRLPSLSRGQRQRETCVDVKSRSDSSSQGGSWGDYLLGRRSRGNALERKSRENSVERKSKGNSLERRSRGNSLERRSRGNSLERRPRGNSLEKGRGKLIDQKKTQSKMDIADGARRRRDSRKRKHSHTPPLPRSQQEVKHARTGNDVIGTSGRCSRESTPLRSSTSAPSVSSFSLSPNFDDIMAPPTPNADEILPYCADVELCENSTVLLYDGGCGYQSLLNMSRPLTPSSELQGEEDDFSCKDIEEKTPTCRDKDKNHKNGRILEPVKVTYQESSVDVEVGGGLESVGEAEELCEEDRLVVRVEENDFELEEGEITDSESECSEEKESHSVRKEANGSAIAAKSKVFGERERRRHDNISRSYVSGRNVDSRRSSDEKSNRGAISSRRCSGGASVRERQRLSPTARPSHHLPLTERRRNRHSPPSSKKRIELFRDQAGRVIRKYSMDERRSQSRSSKHIYRRPNPM